MDDLDPPAWGPPSFTSGLVLKCHELRSKPLSEFSPGDLRIMIGQEIGLHWLVPLAIDILEAQPLVCGDLFEGDLLENTLRVGSEFWRQASEHRDRLLVIINRCEVPDDLKPAVQAFTEDL